jgi:hypothetical protein
MSEPLDKQIVLKNKHFMLQYEVNEWGDYYVHLTVYKWSAAVKKQLLDVGYTWLAMLRAGGVDTVHSCIPATDTKTIKFNKMMGFVESDVDGDNVILTIGV